MVTKKLVPSRQASDKLARARAVGEALSKVTDELNESLIRAEKAFSKLQLGVEGTVVIDPVDEDGEYETLSFEKEGADWRFMVRVCNATLFDREISRTPLLRASKQMRILGAQHLGALLDHMVSLAEAQLTLARAAKSQVDRVVAECEPPAVEDADFDEVPF